MNTFKSLLTVLIVSVLYLSCSDAGSTSTSSEPATISIIGENSSTLNAMMAMKAEYEKKDSTVRLNYLPSDFKDALEKSNQDFSQGKGAYDVVLQYNFTLSPSVRNNYVYRISELTNTISQQDKQFEAQIFPALWQETGYYYINDLNPSAGNQMISYPYLGISMVLMYNKKLFEDPVNKSNYQAKFGKSLTVPTTWEDYYNVAAFFTNPAKKTYGVCIEGEDGAMLVAEWTNYLYGFNGKYLDKELGWQSAENTRLLINTPEALKALTYYKSLKPFNAGGYATVEQSAQLDIMLMGNTAMAIVWTDMLYSKLKSDKGFNPDFGFTTIPGSKSIVCGGAYFINKHSRQPEKAAQFVVDQLQPQNQIKLAKLGYCSPLKSTYADPEVNQLPYSEALYKSLDRGGMKLEAGPDAQIITEKISTYIQKVWFDKMSPADALNEAQLEITTARSKLYKDLKANVQ